MAKKKYVFNLTRTVGQTFELTIKADSLEDAEELFDAQREESDDFADAVWTDGDPEGPLDWEVDGPPD